MQVQHWHALIRWWQGWMVAEEFCNDTAPALISEQCTCKTIRPLQPEWHRVRHYVSDSVKNKMGNCIFFCAQSTRLNWTLKNAASQSLPLSLCRIHITPVLPSNPGETVREMASQLWRGSGSCWGDFRLLGSWRLLTTNLLRETGFGSEPNRPENIEF